MPPLRTMVGRVVPVQGVPERAPLPVLEARAAERLLARIRDLEATVAAQAAEIAKLRARLAAAPASKKRRKADGGHGR